MCVICNLKLFFLMSIILWYYLEISQLDYIKHLIKFLKCVGSDARKSMFAWKAGQRKIWSVYYKRYYYTA